ncbi:MAG: phosphotransferase family protein [Proteobacteria bacterium]|nr:MAG: phosphotransferase family protein [Pseudomonadota bacterium]
MATAGAAPSSDVIPVRPDERFDEARVAAWLRGRLEGADGPLAVSQFGGGHANLTYLLRFGDGPGAREYVLRRPPLGPVAPGSHDMSREHRVLSVLWKAFPLAPRSYLFCDDPALLGAPFFVMERRYGVVVRGGIPESFGGGRDEAANRKLSSVVVDVLADFHAVDPARAELGDLGRPEGFLARQVTGWTARWERSKVEGDPLADELQRWLLDNLPASPPATLLHNDWRLDNMAVAADDPGRCVAVYDWDMCTRGDPLCDLGTVLAVWYDPDEVASSLNPMPTTAAGFLRRDEAARRYGERSGRDLALLPYYLVFGTFKMAVVLQQIYFRYHQGQTKDARFAGMGEGAKALFRLAASRRP